MRTLISSIIICGSLLFAANSFAQGSPKFACPLSDARFHVDSAAAKYAGSEEIKLIISSDSDSLVKASADGVISAVQREPDGTWSIVYNYEDFWFWLSGIQQPLVRMQQRVKKGQAIGKLAVGAQLEILLFDFETPADPMEFLPCFERK